MLYARHGQSAWNLERRFQGQADIGLTNLGRQQAASLGRALAERASVERGSVGGVSADGVGAAAGGILVVSSDLARAADTAREVAGALAAELRLDPRLREVHAGQWQGLLHPEIDARWPAEFAAWRAGEDVPLGGAERLSEAGERVAAAVTELWAAAAALGAELLVLVGHGASLRAGVGTLLDWPGARAALGPAGNTCTAELRCRCSPDGASRWSLVRWNVPPAALGATAPGYGATGSASAVVL